MQFQSSGRGNGFFAVPPPLPQKPPPPHQERSGAARLVRPVAQVEGDGASPLANKTCWAPPPGPAPPPSGVAAGVSSCASASLLFIPWAAGAGSAGGDWRGAGAHGASLLEETGRTTGHADESADGVYLNPEDIAWVLDLIATARSHHGGATPRDGTPRGCTGGRTGSCGGTVEAVVLPRRTVTC